MHPRVCLVTGANTGIGLEIARALLVQGCELLLICRTAAKADAAARELVSSTGSDRVGVIAADLSSLRQVRDAAAEFSRRFDRLDLLVNNAGALFPQPMLSADGHEMSLAVNHLAPFLLTNLLLDHLRAADGGRIVNVNSDAHEHGSVDPDELRMPRRYGGGVGMRAYGNAKLANLMTGYELARRLQGGSVTVNALHPGYVGTGIVPFDRATGLWRAARPFWGLAKRFILTAAEGARTPIYLASSPDLTGVSGRYFVKCRAVRSSRRSYDLALQRRVWDLSERLIRGEGA